MNLLQLKDKSLEDLNVDLNQLSKEHFNLKFQHSVGKLKQTHLISVARRNIARIKTAIHEKSKRSVSDGEW